MYLFGILDHTLDHLHLLNHFVPFTSRVLRTRVNKDYHVRLSLLVDDEHALAILVGCSSEAGLGVQILRSALLELLVGGGELAGRERFTSTGFYDDAHPG